MDVARLVETTVTGLGYELVDFELSGRGLMRVLLDQVMGITVKDCELVSHQLTRLLAVEGVSYGRLEVSSPGLDRPIKKEADFIRFRGQKAQLKLRIPLAGRKNFIGILGSLENGVLQLDVDDKQVLIELSNLDKAHLVPTF
ncbi:ribosome maturation factor RimP [Candidatus Nitrotoga arctica]|nr:ribosome maturation factor RimP [Candidatus Nitrotoga arctica]